MFDPPSILDGPQSEMEVAAFLADCSRARLAVAYWGVGVVDRLGLPQLRQRHDDVTIVCDLRSGSCNPTVVRRLLDLFGPERIRTRDRLHAKVWITDTGCVLGSSNASANGHGHEGNETRSLIEANLAYPLPSAEALSRWEAWFETDVLDDSEPITGPMLQEAEVMWGWRRNGRDGPDDVSLNRGKLLAKALADPGFFREKRITVYVYPGRELEDYEAETINAAVADREAQGFGGRLIGYAGWRGEAGAYLLDLQYDCDAPGKFTFNGLRQVLWRDSVFVSEGKTYTLCSDVKSYSGYAAAGDARAWERAAKQVTELAPLPENGLALDEFARRLATRQESLRL